MLAEAARRFRETADVLRAPARPMGSGRLGRATQCALEEARMSRRQTHRFCPSEGESAQGVEQQIDRYTEIFEEPSPHMVRRSA